MRPRLLLPFLAILLCARTANAQSPVEGISFGSALGFEIGSPISEARAHAEARGEKLVCTSTKDEEGAEIRFCNPEMWFSRPTPPPMDTMLRAVLLKELPMRPPYTLHLTGDTVDAIGLRLADAFELTRADVIDRMDALAPRAVEGYWTNETSTTRMIYWAHPAGLDWALLDCPDIEGVETTSCSLLLARADSPEKLQRTLESWREVLTPEP